MNKKIKEIIFNFLNKSIGIISFNRLSLVIRNKNEHVNNLQKFYNDKIDSLNKKYNDLLKFIYHPYYNIENKILFIDVEFNTMYEIHKKVKNSDYIKINLNNIDFEYIKKIYSYKIIVVDSTYPFLKVTNKKNQIIVCIWHGIGAFKKCGKYYDKTYLKNYDSKNIDKYFCGYIDYLIVSSSKITKIYSDAFNIDEKFVKPLGIPRETAKKNHNELSNDEKYIQNKLNSKKIYLIVPTYSKKENSKNEIGAFWYIDFKKIDEILSDDEIVLYKIHPRFLGNKNTDFSETKNKVFDVSKMNNLVKNIEPNVLCTDYSSAFFEFKNTSTKFMFYRTHTTEINEGLFIDYNTLPGVILDTKKMNLENKEEEFVKALRKASVNRNIYNDFWNFHTNKNDGNETKRIVNFLEKLLNE